MLTVNGNQEVYYKLKYLFFSDVFKGSIFSFYFIPYFSLKVLKNRDIRW
jgi:hypothetical protein